MSDLAGRFFLDPAFEADDGFVANGPSHVSGKEKRKLIVEGKEREIGSIFPAPNKRLVAIRRWFYPGEGPEVIIIINDKGDVVARVDIPEK